VAVVAAIAVAIWAVSQPPAVAGAPNKPGTKPGPGPANVAANTPGGERPRPRPLSPLEVPKETEWNKVKTAKTLPECTAAMVKIMFPTGGQGAVLGSGFLIDKRGWVATNYHVIEKANSAIRCYMSDGKDYAVEGLLSQDKERDLAIIKMKDLPFQMTLLDTKTFGDPDVGTEIYCYGHPHGVDFSVSSGVVGRVCATDKLDDGSQAFLYSSHNTPPDMVWIQVDAKINPGNSGGPLIDKKTFKVLGVNSWVNRQVGFGYASHVQHLRDLVARTTDTVKEFPKPEKSPEFAGVAPLPDNFSAKMIEEKLKSCQDFNWLPAKSDDTTALLEFARLMHGAREIARNPEAAEGIDDARNREINAAATNAWQVLAGLDWNTERVAAINKVASRIMDKPGFGVIALCECVAPEGEGPVLKIIGTEHNILAALDAPQVFQNGQKVLVIGLSTPLMGALRTPDMKESVKVRYVKSHFTRVIGK
jgi:S1-C subfamily serine protease